MHSYVRFATAAALIAFGGIIGAGAIALVPAAIERIPAIRAEGPPASACDPQTRLPWERNCPAEAAVTQQPPPAGAAPREAANAAADVPPPARIVEVPAPARTVEAPPPARTAEVPPPTLTAPQPPVRDNARAAPTPADGGGRHAAAIRARPAGFGAPGRDAARGDAGGHRSAAAPAGSKGDNVACSRGERDGATRRRDE